MRHALRTWSRRPWLALAAIVSLGLGIGANTAIFSVMNSVVLRPLPFPQSDELVAIWETSGDNPARWMAPANYLDWQRTATSFASMAAYDGFPLSLTGRGEAERLTGGGASGTFFTTLGVSASHGRTLLPTDDAAGAPPVAVVTDGLARRLFGQPERAVGEQLTLEGRSHEVVGVLPIDFSMPTLPNVEIWVSSDRGVPRSFPFPGDITTVRDSHILLGVARLRVGVAAATAEAELQAIMTRLAREYPDTNAGLGAHVVPLHTEVVGNAESLILFLQLAVVAMLAIGCANVASLLLGHFAGRQRELATRLALGASRGRLAAHLVGEAAVIAVSGGLVGLLLAAWGLEALVAMAPAALPRVSEIGIDGRVLLFTTAVTMLTTVAFGLGPALGSAGRAAAAVSLSGLRVAGDRSVSRWHRALVVGELATAQVLLAGAALMLASFVEAQRVPMGFESDGRIAATLSLTPDPYLRPIGGGDDFRADVEPRRQLVEHVLERLRSTSGVRAAAAAFTPPLAGAPNRGLRIIGAPEPSPNEEPSADFQIVTPGFFTTNGIPLIAGRAFTVDDRAGTRSVAVVNQTFAERYFPGRSPLGQSLAFGGQRRHEIVGVVGDARYRDVERPADATFYVPMDQNDERWPYLAFMAWTDGDAAALAPAIRAAVHGVNPNQPLARIQTYDEILSRSRAPRRFNAVLAGVFALTALTLAAVGTYGVLAYAVGCRTRELGVRMALGATPQDLGRLVAGQGGLLMALALVIGGGGAWLASRWMTTLVFQVRPNDPRTLVGVTAVLALVAAIAIWLPTRRASATNPNVALREP